MSKPKSLIFTFAILIIAQSCFALSGVPDLVQSIAQIAFTGPGTASLLVVPDGSGPRFTEAHDEQGNVIDATITLLLLDPMGAPIVNFPFEDLWLESTDGGLVGCNYGVIADHHTDANGITSWVNPPVAMGHSQSLVQVFVNGSPLVSGPGLPLRFNSPDINGDGFVNLQDLPLLSVDLYSTLYSFRSDFNGDGILNLQDIAIFAQHYGAQCP